MPDEQFFVDADGKVVKQAPAHRQIKQFEAVAVFVVDPEKPRGTRRTWRMVEVTEGAPILDTLYFPKWHRRMGTKAAIPQKLTIRVTCEYFKADPGPLGGA